jgi:hypothetical protein
MADESDDQLLERLGASRRDIKKGVARADALVAAMKRIDEMTGEAIAMCRQKYARARRINLGGWIAMLIFAAVLVFAPPRSWWALGGLVLSLVLTWVVLLTQVRCPCCRTYLGQRLTGWALVKMPDMCPRCRFVFGQADGRRRSLAPD